PGPVCIDSYFYLPSVTSSALTVVLASHVGHWRHSSRSVVRFMRRLNQDEPALQRFREFQQSSERTQVVAVLKSSCDVHARALARCAVGGHDPKPLIVIDDPIRALPRDRRGLIDSPTYRDRAIAIFSGIDQQIIDASRRASGPDEGRRKR